MEALTADQIRTLLQAGTLTKLEKLELLDILERKATLQKRKRDTYKPHTGQADVHRCNKQLRFVFAGNGSGKTALGGNEIVWAALGYNPELDAYTPVPSRIFIICDKPEKVSSVIIPELRKWTDTTDWQFNKGGKPYISSILAPNGSTITFLFHDQEPMTAEGVEGDFFWFDEPCPRNLFISLRRAGRTKGRPPRYLFTGTPISAPWLRTDIYEPWLAGELPEAECFRFGTALNEDNLIEGYIDQFGRLLTEKEKRIRFEGEFFDLDGLALAHLFRRDVHIIDPFDWPADWPVSVSIDVHGTKPNYACMLGCDRDGRLFYIKEMRHKLVAREFAAELKDFMAGYKVVDIVCDSLGSADSSGHEGFKSFIQVLQECGIRVRPTTYDDKRDEEWITRIQGSLAIPTEPDSFGERLPKLRIFAGNHGIVGDIESVCWEKMRGVDELKPKLAIGNKDWLATLKYSLASGLTPQRGSATAYVRSKPATTYGQKPASKQRAEPRRQLRRNRFNVSRFKRRAAEDDDD